MDQTVNYGFPYPECAPPLVKDASDIAQMRDLAVAVDTAVQGVYDTANDAVIRPDSARMTASTVTATSAQMTAVYDGFTFNTRAGLADTAAGVLRIQESGWYMAGHWAVSVSAGTQQLSIRFLKNGAYFGNWCSPGSRGAKSVSHTEVMRLSAGDTLTTAIIDWDGSTGWTFATRIWITQLYKV